MARQDSPADPPARRDTVDARVLAALALRDRARLAAAVEQIEGLKARLATLESSRAYVLAAAAQRRFLRLPAWLRTALLRAARGGAAPANAAADVAALDGPALPSTRPPEPAASAPNGIPRRAPSAAPVRGVAVVVDHHWPRPDRDAGSVEIANLLGALQGLGFAVHFVAAREADGPSDAREALRRAGMRTWQLPGPVPADRAGLDAADAAVAEYLAGIGPSVDLAVLCRAFCGGHFLDAAQRHCGKARLVFNSIDLHFVREARRAEVTEDAAVRDTVALVREREERLIRTCDATVVVSRAELDLLAQEYPEAYAVELPLARPAAPPAAPFGARRGIGFIGGHGHAPNADAVRYLLDEVWPLILRDLPDAELSIVGAGYPADLLDGRPGRVRALGHVPDVGPWFESLRLTVAPLRFGAGAKGKVASSLAAGVPCVATPVAAEGMLLEGGSGVVVASDPAEFAARVRDVHEDPALWARLSADGLAHARTALSPEAWRGRLEALLVQLGV